MSITVEGGIATVIVSDPDRGCSLDIPGLDHAATVLREDDSIRAVVLQGPEGMGFCNGGDVKAFAAADDPGAYLAEIAAPFHRFVSALRAIDAPSIAAVRGFAAGGGMSIACAATLAVGGPGTRFVPAYPTIGFSTDGGLSWTLPRIVGQRQAARIILANQILDSSEAQRLGLLGDVTGTDEDVVPHARAMAEKLAAASRTATTEILRLLRASDASALGEHLDAEAAAIARTAGSADGREGVAAFLAKRPPRFEP
ncbi:enoyl-CoA hydratase/isomerase family protein [Hoyosella sp. G463]|uniref:Enoyl-CoA hydratase/isomerase family protein n=1 Tax=Lolliginicoccus lacisalsi TaxID=2742202 RepID=A0A927JF59_9ACTN|nr:enoyl-CoA hydratase/isomerase family protein [Lolliginicoccus lacisalsi]